MSDETPEETPDKGPELSKEQLDEFFAAAAADVGHDPSTELWMQFHEIYLGLVAGGFDKVTAVEIIVSIMFKFMQQEGGAA